MMKTIYHDLAGKKVAITGGANGIGAAMVKALVCQGAQVYFCDRDSEAGSRLAVECGAQFAEVDLQEAHSIVGWIAQLPPLDVLINNAARDPRISLADTTVEAWDELFALNLRAYFLTVREAVRRMPYGGSIINFSSITAHTGPAGMAAYVATKTGIIGLTRSLARELGPRGIRVNVLSPGWVMTERQLREYVDDGARKLIADSQCIRDLLQPEDIAEVALFLASNASSAMTGQELLADRGWAFS